MSKQFGFGGTTCRARSCPVGRVLAWRCMLVCIHAVRQITGVVEAVQLWGVGGSDIRSWHEVVHTVECEQTKSCGMCEQQIMWMCEAL